MKLEEVKFNDKGWIKLEFDNIDIFKYNDRYRVRTEYGWIYFGKDCVAIKGKRTFIHFNRKWDYSIRVDDYFNKNKSFSTKLTPKEVIIILMNTYNGKDITK